MLRFAISSLRHIARGVFTASLAFAVCPVTSSLAAETFGLGRTPAQNEIERIDIDVMPDGRGLPSGQGSAREGRPLYELRCAQCHGEEGLGGAGGALAGAPAYSAAEFAADRSLPRTVGNYWPWATSLFDYIRRAMPFDQPGSLRDDEVYALTAYILYLNDLIGEQSVMDRQSLPEVSMPARRYFRDASAW